MSRLTRHRHLFVLGVILSAGLVLRAWGLTWGLHNADVSRRPHPDEWVVYWVFQWFGAHRDLNPCPQPAHQCFYDWGGPYLYLSYAMRLLLSPVWASVSPTAFGPHADGVFVYAALSGRITSVVASTLTIVFVYRIGAVLRGPTLGLIAAGVVALAGLLIQLAHFATQDSVTLLLMTVALFAILRTEEAPSLRRFAVAGGAVGLAAGSEYHMALLLLPLLTAWWTTGRRERAAMLAALACAAVAWMAVNPYAVAQPGPFIGAAIHSVQVRTVDSAAQSQGRWSQYGSDWLYIVRYPFGYGVGFAFTAWLMAGACWAAFRRRRGDLVLLTWVLPYFVLVSVSPARYMRYSAPLLPALSVLAAAVFLDVWTRRSVRSAVVAVAIASVAYSFLYDAAYASLFTQPDPRQVATTWLKQHAGAHAQIGFEEIPNGLLNLPYFVTSAGYQPCFSTFQPETLAGPERYFMLDDYDLEEHPDVDFSAVHVFRRALSQNPDYRLVYRLQYEPNLFGINMSIAGSPHDWRYPARTISVYRHLTPGETGSGQCYPTMRAALRALYVTPSPAA